MSSFYIPTILTLLILTLLPFSTPQGTPLVDISGNAIKNGESYYIVEIIYGIPEKGLTYHQRNKNECPLYITEPSFAHPLGSAVKIEIPLQIPFIFEDLPVTLSFTDSKESTSCKTSSLVWTRAQDSSSGNEYITTGGGGYNTDDSFFVFNKEHKSILPEYLLQSCKIGATGTNDCSNVGYLKGGFLGIAKPPFRVAFIEAPKSFESNIGLLI